MLLILLLLLIFSPCISATPREAQHEVADSRSSLTHLAHLRSSEGCRGEDCHVSGVEAEEPLRRRFDGAVGVGFDSLTATIKCPIYETSYSLRKTTGDNVFLVPDHVSVVPVLDTQMNIVAEYFTTFDEVIKSNIVGVSVGAGGSTGNFTASASFSTKWTNIQRHMHTYQSSLLHTRLAHHGYDLLVDPTAPFEDSFAIRLESIADAIEKNLTLRAAYLAELLVRDCGTHVITSAAMSAIIEKNDYLTSDFIGHDRTKELEVKADISASFFGFSASASTHTEVSTQIREEIKKATTHSEIHTVGGPDIVQFTSNNFSKQLLVQNLRPFPQGGLPIADVITQMGPRRDYEEVAHVRNAIRTATRRYLDENKIPGCTKPGPGFNYMANVPDDSACVEDVNGTFYGGVYTICTVPRGSWFRVSDDECNPHRVRNIKTGAFNCPPGYDAVRLFKGFTRPEVRRYKECDDCYLFGTCCDHFEYSVYFNLEAFWCRPQKDTVDVNSGVFFGGIIHGEQGDNHFTGSTGCPPAYTPFPFFDDLRVCLGEPTQTHPVPELKFGGIFSTQAPAACPAAFSPYSLSTSHGCDITACTHVTRQQINMPVRKVPPFTDPEAANRQRFAEPMLLSSVNGEPVASARFEDVWSQLADNEQNDTRPTAREALVRVKPLLNKLVQALYPVAFIETANAFGATEEFSQCHCVKSGRFEKIPGIPFPFKCACENGQMRNDAHPAPGFAWSTWLGVFAGLVGVSFIVLVSFGIYKRRAVRGGAVPYNQIEQEP